MPNVIIFVLAYGVASFVLTTLFVRLEDKTALAAMARRHLYCFLLMPPMLVGWGLLQVMSRLLWLADSFLRYCFEALSGKKAYRRQKIDQYYND